MIGLVASCPTGAAPQRAGTPRESGAGSSRLRCLSEYRGHAQNGEADPLLGRSGASSLH